MQLAKPWVMNVFYWLGGKQFRRIYLTKTGSSLKNLLVIFDVSPLIVCIWVPVPPLPFLRHPPLHLACSRLFKIFVSPPLVSVPPHFKACVCYFLANFYFSQNDNPSKTMKDVFYFI